MDTLRYTLVYIAWYASLVYPGCT